MARVQGVIQKVIFLAIGLWAVQAFGQSSGNGSISSIFNSRLASSLPHADTVPISQAISQIADGAGWKTTIILANTDVVPANFTVQFWNHDGTPLSLPLVSQGSQQQVTGTIPVNGSVTLESVGDIGGNFSQGWGLLTTTNSIGGTVVFRQTVPGKQVSEAAVPLTKPISTMLILPYDNTPGFTTAAALVNADPNNTAVITANLYDQSGNSLGSSVINLPPQSQQTFALPTMFPSTANVRGIANFSSASVPITGLGLRFSGPVFTSIEMQVPPTQ
jgi:hypothetical protein